MRSFHFWRALGCLLLGFAAGASAAKADEAATGDTQVVQGVVDDVSGGDIVIRSGNDRVRIGVFPSQVTDIERGQEVKVYASPVLEGERVTPLAAQKNPQGLRLTGRVADVMEDILVLRPAEGGLREIRIDPRTARTVRRGDEVMVDIDTGQQGLRALGIVPTRPPAVQ